MPTEAYPLNFDSDDEPEEMEAGHAFFEELQDRGHDVYCGYQLSQAVFELVVGKPGGTVMIDAGLREGYHKKNQIIVGKKGKIITAQDFNRVSLQA